MATLMQQTNCIKTLANGGLNANDPAEGQPLQTTGSGLEKKRDLLPHELGNLPSGMMSHPHQQQHLQSQYNNFGYYNNLHHHQNHTTSHPHLLLPHQQTINNHVFVQSTTTSVNTTPSNTSSSSSSLSSTTHSNQQQHIFSQNTANNTTNTTTSSQSSQHQQQQQHAQANHVNHHHHHQQSSSARGQGDMQNGAGCSSTATDLDRLHGGGTTADTSTAADSNSPAFNADASTATVNSATGGVVDDADQEPEPEIDIVINNVVCSFSVRCHLNLREIALNGVNVEFRRENGMVTMKLRRPYTTASIWSSGRITCTGATSEDQVTLFFVCLIFFVVI